MNLTDRSPAGQDMRPLRPLNATQAPAPMPDTPLAKTLRDIALEWLMRVQQAPEDQALRAALAHWLATAPEHLQAYRSAQRLWQLTGQLAPSTRAQWPTPPAVPVVLPARLPERLPRTRSRWPQLVGLGLAACLLIAWAPSLWLRLQADYRSGFAEQQRVTLADGSVVQLDADSAIAVHLGERRRDVRLLRGQAFFEVAADATRPFHVNAGHLDVRVTGTAFNVEHRSHGETVAVEHGSVQVRDLRTEQLLSTGLTAGQVLSSDDRLEQPQLGTLPVSQLAAWRQHQLIANDQRLGEVIQSLQRYLPGKLLIDDDSLAQLRITGLYNLDQPAWALRAMLEPHGGKLTTYGDYLWVISR